MYVPAFDDLVGSEEDFFSNYFNKRPFLRRDALKGDPGCILSIADLDQLLHFEAIRPPYFGALEGGQSVPPSAYTKTTSVQSSRITDTVVPEKAYDLFRAGSTLTWIAVNHFHANTRALTAMLADKFAVECRASALLTPAGGSGFTSHHDPVDIFAIQLEGTKHWKIWDPPPDRRPDIGHYKAEELGEPVIDSVLQPGDVCYLPYGSPHQVNALDQVSLHLSVLVKPRTWRDLLGLTVDRLLESEEFAEFPQLNDSRVAAESGVFAERVAMLVKHLREVNAEDELQRVIPMGQQRDGSSSGHTFQTIAASKAIGPSLGP